MSSPTGTVARVMMISAKRLWSSVCASPAASVEQGLAGAGLAEQGDEVDLRVHQQVQREVLFAVARGDPPDRVLVVGVVLDRLQDGGAAVEFAHLREQRQVAVEVDELVQAERRHQRPGDAVVGVALLLPGLHLLAVRVPEVRRQLRPAGIHQVQVVGDLVAEIVLGGEARAHGP